MPRTKIPQMHSMSLQSCCPRGEAVVASTDCWLDCFPVSCRGCSLETQPGVSISAVLRGGLNVPIVTHCRGSMGSKVDTTLKI